MEEPSPDSHQFDFTNPSHTSVFIKDDFVIVNVVIQPGITNEFKFKRTQQTVNHAFLMHQI